MAERTVHLIFHYCNAVLACALMVCWVGNVIDQPNALVASYLAVMVVASIQWAEESRKASASPTERSS